MFRHFLERQTRTSTSAIWFIVWKRPFSNRALTAISPGLGTSLVTIFLEIDIARFSGNTGSFGQLFFEFSFDRYKGNLSLNYQTKIFEERMNFSFYMKNCFFFHLFFISRLIQRFQCTLSVFNDKSHPLILKESKGSNFTKCLHFSSEEFWMKRYCSIFNLRFSHTTEISFSIARKIKYRLEK